MSTNEMARPLPNRDVRARKILALGTLTVGMLAGGFGGYEFQKGQEHIVRDEARAAAAVDAACIESIQQSGNANSPHPTVRFNLLHPEQADACSPYFSESLQYGTTLSGTITEVSVRMPSVAQLRTDEAKHTYKAEHYISTGDRVAEVAMTGMLGLLGGILSVGGLIYAVGRRDKKCGNLSAAAVEQ
ncbi:MAG: hypothetical protein Q7R60_02750 [bacterium]|nr:hypothetical protein [bacterium]